MRDADVVIVSHQLGSFPYGSFEFHRTIVDEIHAIRTTAGVSPLGSFSWGVTGSPCTTSATELVTQATPLSGFASGRLRADDVSKEWERSCPPEFTELHRHINTGTEATIAEYVRELMIRHTKTQRIGGEVALALPSTDCSTVWLETSSDERTLYTLLKTLDGAPPYKGAQASQLGLQGITERRKAAANVYSKLAKYAGGESSFAPMVGRARRTGLTGNVVLSALQHLQIPAVKKSQGPASVEKLNWQNCTKVRALKRDLDSLRATARMHALVFTHFKIVQ